MAAGALAAKSTQVMGQAGAGWSVAGCLRRLLVAAIFAAWFNCPAFAQQGPIRTAPNQVPRSFVYPVMAPRLSSDFGFRIHPIRRFSHKHSGIDLAAPVGSPIRAVAAGRVVFADPYAGFGNLVVIQHTSHLTSHYAHCYSLKVRPGQQVKAGEIIALVGNTGMSTGPHLHFEIRIDGEPRNPEAFIPGLADEGEG